MSSNRRKLRLAGSFATLLIFAIGVGCTGFFQNPTVTSLTIDPPNPSVSIGFTTQLYAAGTDSNGNGITLTGGTSCTGSTVCWSSSAPSVATISVGGQLKGITAGTATITASSGTASATTTATVTLSNVTSIVLGPNGITSFSLPESTTATASSNQCLTAIATAGGQTIDITTSVTWQTGTPNIVTVENGVDPMCVTSQTTAGPTTVYATYVSGDNTITSNSVTITVTP
jgi:trimeric autotransporter adhesin